VSDAHIAVVASDHNATVATFDTDFDRMPVTVVHPPLFDAGSEDGRSSDSRRARLTR